MKEKIILAGISITIGAFIASIVWIFKIIMENW